MWKRKVTAGPFGRHIEYFPNTLETVFRNTHRLYSRRSKTNFPSLQANQLHTCVDQGLKFDIVNVLRQSLYTECNYGGHSDGPGQVARKRGRGATLFLVSWLSRMAASGLTEDDIPGASLAGRSPTTLKNEELRFWLKWRIEVWNSGRGMSITMVSA